MRQSLFAKASFKRCFNFLPIALILLMLNEVVSHAAISKGDQLLSFFPENISLRVKLVGDPIDSVQSPMATYQYSSAKNTITWPAVPIYTGSPPTYKKISYLSKNGKLSTQST